MIHHICISKSVSSTTSESTEQQKDYAGSYHNMHAPRAFFLSVYLNLHIAEKRPTVQQLVVLPAPTNLTHVAPPGQRSRSAGGSSPQVAEVTCGLRRWGAHANVARIIVWPRPVVSDSIWTLLGERNTLNLSCCVENGESTIHFFVYYACYFSVSLKIQACANTDTIRQFLEDFLWLFEIWLFFEKKSEMKSWNLEAPQHRNRYLTNSSIASIKQAIKNTDMWSGGAVVGASASQKEGLSV